VIQPYLLPVVGIASPLCMYEHCRRKGRAVLGPVRRVTPDCENTPVRCLTCGCTGELSRNLLAKARKVAA